jgi:hypothetical protein
VGTPKKDFLEEGPETPEKRVEYEKRVEEPIIQKMWELRRLKTLWASMAYMLHTSIFSLLGSNILLSTFICN